jgi:hypothetical protein
MEAVGSSSAAVHFKGAKMSESLEPGDLPGMLRDATSVRVVLADADRRPDCMLEVSEIHWERRRLDGHETLWFRVTEGSMVGIV